MILPCDTKEGSFLPTEAKHSKKIQNIEIWWVKVTGMWNLNSQLYSF